MNEINSNNSKFSKDFLICLRKLLLYNENERYDF